MNFRNPELQRLLDNLNNAARDSKLHNGSQRNLDATATSNSRAQSGVPGLKSPSQGFIGRAPEPQEGFSTALNNDAVIDGAERTSASLKPPVNRSQSTTPSPQPVPDASTITTWPAAIKHVTRHIITDDRATTRIKHLVRQQQQHEEQWWSQREAIVARHQGRANSNTKVADILKELGGLALPIAKVDDAADKNELDAFDKKVYQLLVQMAVDFDSQLRKLGVPFYAIKHELILSETGSDKDLTTTKGKLDKGELRDLQRRMLHHLEDLLVDD